MSRRTSDAVVDPADEKADAYLDPGAEEIEGANNERMYSIDLDEERKLVRKLDMVIMPLLILVYFFQCGFITNIFSCSLVSGLH